MRVNDLEGEQIERSMTGASGTWVQGQMEAALPKWSLSYPVPN